MSSSASSSSSVVQFATNVGAPEITKEIDASIEEFRKTLLDEKEYSNDYAREYCTKDCLHRYLRARGYNLKKAKEMILAALTWRNGKKPDLIKAASVETEARTGKIYLPGLDRHNRPILVLHNSKENTFNYEQNINFLCFNLERATRFFANGVEKYLIFIHLEDFSMWNSPPMKTSMETLTILTGRYPEHLGHCILWQPPTVFGMLWKACTPFLDQHTVNKILFVNGEYKEGSKNDLLMNDILGPNWRVMCGVDQPAPDAKISPGYVHTTMWAKVVEDEEAYLKQLQEKKGEEKKEEKKEETTTTTTTTPEEESHLKERKEREGEEVEGEKTPVKQKEEVKEDDNEERTSLESPSSPSFSVLSPTYPTSPSSPASPSTTDPIDFSS